MDLKARQQKQLYIILTVIVILGALFPGLKYLRNRPLTEREMSSVKLQSGFQTKDIGAVKFESGVAKYELYTDANNQWKLKSEDKGSVTEAFADNIKIDEWLKKLNDLESMEFITNNKDSRTAYFLAEGQGNKITLKTKTDGKELLTFIVGKAGEAPNSAYVWYKDAVYSFTSDFFETARQDYKLWRSLRMMQMKTEDVTSVDTRISDIAWNVKFTGDKWVYGDNSPADGAKVIAWLATARDTQATQIVDDFTAEKGLPKDWSVAKDYLTVTFKDKSQIALRMAKGDETNWYVKNFQSNIVYKVAEPILFTMIVKKENFKPNPEESKAKSETVASDERYGSDKPKLKLKIEDPN